MTNVISPPSTATYGIDAPNQLIGLSVASILALLIGLFLAAGSGPLMGLVPWGIAATLACAAVWVAVGTRYAKPRLWRSRLDALGLAGNERALDLGCGRGLVLIETAKRLPDGRAEGVDIWRNRDQSGNQRVMTELNVRIEGVEDRVAIHDADITRLPFGDASFDLVTASFTLRSLPRADERAEAIAQIARVIRPGGQVIVLDDRRTAELAQDLVGAGFTGVVRSSPRWAFAPPARLVTATWP